MDINDILKNNDYKATKERLKLFKFIKQKHLFSYSDLLGNFKDISRASIFRTINLFLKLGIIRKIDLGNKSDTYEINNKKHHHEHMKCTKCGKIINFDSERICSILFKQAKKMGFNIQTHNIGILGICKNCN